MQTAISEVASALQVDSVKLDRIVHTIWPAGRNSRQGEIV